MTILYAILTLSAIGVFAAVILFALAQKFKVHEDPRIDQVEELLPGANCGACGFAGCRNFAEAIVKAEDLSELHCPVCGNDGMGKVAAFLGREAVVKDPLIAVVRCQGSFDKRPRTNHYDSARSCAIASMMYSGDTGCAFGCLSLGDCVVACRFDAIHMDEATGLPVVDEDKCTACGACVPACPKQIIELRKKGKRGMRIYVDCINEDKGGVARKSCQAACIGCGKCVKICPFDAITLENNLAYINFEKCRLCRKCVEECPTRAIVEVNFPVRKPKAPAPATAAADGTQ